MTAGKREKIKFKEMKDVWDYIFLLKEESDEKMKKGSEFKTLTNIYEQLPFFCCVNKLLDIEYQHDIYRYTYCKETNTPPYAGAYDEIPALWLNKYSIIKTALMIRENQLRERARNAN